MSQIEEKLGRLEKEMQKQGFSSYKRLQSVGPLEKKKWKKWKNEKGFTFVEDNDDDPHQLSDSAA